MKFFQSIFAFYINSSIHVALAVVALLGVTFIEYNLNYSAMLVGFVFTGTITGYNFLKYSKIAGLHHRSLTNSLKSIQVFSFICFALLVYFSFQLPIKALIVSVICGLLTLFYAIPFVNKKSLRTLSGFKIFVVAAVWAGITVIVPFVFSEQLLNLQVWVTFIQRFFIVVVLTLPFEIRDIPYDRDSLRTLPQKLGIFNTKLLGIGLLCGCLILELLKNGFYSFHSISLMLTALFCGGLLLKAQTQQTRYFASFWVEGIPILWVLILWLLWLYQFPFPEFY